MNFEHFCDAATDRASEVFFFAVSFVYLLNEIDFGLFSKLTKYDHSTDFPLVCNQAELLLKFRNLGKKN